MARIGNYGNRMSPQLIAHRGLWEVRSCRNTREAFRRAWAAGYGIETDVRDLGGSLVISHDMPQGGEQPFEEFLDDYVAAGYVGTLALNIKADGLAAKVREACADRTIENYFCFDMSIPDARAYLQRGMPVFGRLSELEPPSSFTRLCAGIWLDAFESCWFDTRVIRDVLAGGQDVCLVSPELHGRDPEELWNMLRLEIAGTTDETQPGGAGVGRVLLCTDYAAAWSRRIAA
jgi:hypothetical protein